MGSTRTRLAAVALALLATGCVRKSVYESALADIAARDQEIAACRGEKEGLGQDLARCRATHEEALARIDSLIGRLRALDQDVGRLEEERARLAMSLEVEKSRARELERQRQLAQARIDTFRRLLDRFRSMIESGQVEVKVVRGRMVVKMPSSILFDSGRTDIKPEGQEVLARITQVLAEIPNRTFQVEGHTDDQPIRTARFPSNWELSTARATEVVRFMISQGMPPERISAAGYSEFQPVAPNDTPEGRALNRRIEIALMPNLDELPDLSDLVAAQPAPAAAPAAGGAEPAGSSGP